MRKPRNNNRKRVYNKFKMYFVTFKALATFVYLRLPFFFLSLSTFIHPTSFFLFIFLWYILCFLFFSFVRFWRICTCIIFTVYDSTPTQCKNSIHLHTSVPLYSTGANLCISIINVDNLCASNSSPVAI